LATIYQTNKKTGITYVIESESYWDKEKQQPRSHRTIIGKIDIGAAPVPLTGKAEADIQASFREEVNPMDQMTVTADVSQVKTVTRFVNQRLDEVGCSGRIRTQMDVAIDELFSNIAHYAYHPDTEPATVMVEVEEDPLCVVITFVDQGAPYDPLAEERPDVTRLPRTERPIGGLGLFMVKKTMDDVSYKKFGLYVTAGSDYHGRNKLISLGETNLNSEQAVPEGLKRFLERVDGA